MDNMIYHEIQRFRQWWLLITVVAATAWVLFTIINYGREDNWAYIGIFALIMPLLLLLSMKMETKITDTGVHVSMFPLLMRTRHFEWSDIDKAYMRTYQPLKEYGGWGIKGTGSNRAYNVSGKEGLQLELKDGRRILIGTQKPQEMDEVLRIIHKNTSGRVR